MKRYTGVPVTRNGKHYLFDSYTYDVVKISEDEYNVFVKMMNEIAIENMLNTHEILRKMYECNICFHDNLKDEKDVEDKTAYLSLAPTHECNLRCKYCFAKSGKKYTENVNKKKSFNKKENKTVLDTFFYKMYPDYQRYRIDFVSGGEPLLGVNVSKM